MVQYKVIKTNFATHLPGRPQLLPVGRVVVDVGVPPGVRVERGAVHELALPAALQRHAQQRRRHLRGGAPPALRRGRRRAGLRGAGDYYLVCFVVYMVREMAFLWLKMTFY